jgi:succinoglycan biosynthesis transport protein ExoP
MENRWPVDRNDSSSPSLQQSNPYYYGHYQEELKQNRLYDVWNILIKRKRLILSVFCVIFLSVAVKVYLTTPTYRATTTLQITEDNTAAVLGGKSFSALTPDDVRFYETQYLLLESRTLAKKIVDDLNLKEHDFKSLYDRMKKKNDSPQEIESALIDAFLGKLTIKPLKTTNLVEISFESSDRQMAKDVANAFYKEYVNLSMSTRKQSYALIKDWLQVELSKLSNKVETSEKKLYDYGKKKKFLAIEGEKGSNYIAYNKYAELSALLTKAQTEKSKLEAQYRQINDKRNQTSLIISNPVIQKLREDTIAQEAKVANLNQIYGENYPELQAQKATLNELRSRLNNEIKRVRDSIAADYQAAVKTEKLLREELEAQRSKVEQFQDNLVQHRILKRDMETNEQLYNALLARMKEASVASTMVASNVALITPAELPTEPYKPKKVLNLLLAGLIGAITGTGLAFVMEHLDRSIKTSDELEKVCRIPSLGIVPLLPGKRSGRIPLLSRNSKTFEGNSEMELITFKEPMSLISEAIYHIRTSLEAPIAGERPRVILVTSPYQNEGKTSISINLASAMAASGRKVIFIDADLRKPSAHRFFQQPIQPGLTDFLTGSGLKEEIIRATFIPNLYFIPAGEVSSNPVTLLTSPVFADFIRSLPNDFQNVIIDSPPIIGFTDGRIISTLADGVLMVLKHHFTTREAGRLAVQLLSQLDCKILGGVLNMAGKNNMGYYGLGEYYRYYSKSYGQYSYLQRPEDVEAKLHLPLLTTVPYLNGIPSSQCTEIALVKDARIGCGLLGEAGKNFDTLYQQLVSVDGVTSGAPQAIGVISCHHGEGSSTVATNLAATLARNSNERVLFVEANLLKPSAHLTFGVVRSPGLTDAIRDKDFSVGIRSSACSNLDVMTSGQGDLTVSELAEAKEFSEMLDIFKNEYRYVVFDLPPVFNSQSALRLASKTDSVVFVVGAERVNWKVAHKAKEQLIQAKARVIGVVLNKRF